MKIATEVDVAAWQEIDKIIDKVCKTLKCKPDDMVDRVQALLDTNEKLKLVRAELEAELSEQKSRASK
jgi:hypothetical protein